MKTYQDFLIVGESVNEVMDFVLAAINDHKNSELYQTAIVANEYFCHRNRTIREYQKLLYTVTGKAVPDNYSANWKMGTNFFRRFVLQETQYLLGNGANFENEATKDKLGADFDTRLQEVAQKALVGGVAFGFYNLDHLEVFGANEFVPLYDEENGALMAGIRFWQIDSNKPLRATFYETDGYTNFIWRKSEGQVLHDKRAYITKVATSAVDGERIYDYENYPTFPIIPLWGNQNKQSELVGIREQIDCYDFIKSGFANDIDDASMIYWTVQNAGGMDDLDLAKFVERMKTVHAAVIDEDGASAESHTIDVPYASREALLDRLSKDIYRDAMALDTVEIASGAVTATQIKAAYEPLNSKCDDFEYCLHDFIDGILAVLGIDGESVTFTRSALINTTEEIQSVVQAAMYLDGDYVTRKILEIFGDGDKADEILKHMDADELSRMGAVVEEEPEEEPEEETTEV